MGIWQHGTWDIGTFGHGDKGTRRHGNTWTWKQIGIYPLDTDNGTKRKRMEGRENCRRDMQDVSKGPWRGYVKVLGIWGGGCYINKEWNTMENVEDSPRK
jgi:hypothetical protein